MFTEYIIGKGCARIRDCMCQEVCLIKYVTSPYLNDIVTSEMKSKCQIFLP